MRDVTAQPFEALLLLHGGMLTGLVYLILRTARVRVNRRAATHLLDAVFVLLAGAIFAGYLYLANCGTVRGFLCAAFLVGFFTSYALFSPMFSMFSQKIRKK